MSQEEAALYLPGATNGPLVDHDRVDNSLTDVRQFHFFQIIRHLNNDRISEDLPSSQPPLPTRYYSCRRKHGSVIYAAFNELCISDTGIIRVTPFVFDICRYPTGRIHR